MNNTTNSSAPSSPTGTNIKAAANSPNLSNSRYKTDNFANNQQDSDSQHQPEKLARSRSLSDVSPCNSPKERLGPHQEPPVPALESLKVKIKTNNITNTIFATTATNDSNNNNSNNSKNNSPNLNNVNKISANNTSIKEDSTNNKNTAISHTASTPSKVSTSNNRTVNRKSKQNNSDTTSHSASNNSSFSSTGSNSSPTSIVMSSTNPQSIMNNHESPSMSENGNKTIPSSSMSQLSNQSPQVQPIQQQQQQLQQPIPLANLPQPQAPTQPPPTLATTRSANSPASTTATPKPKSTRAKKQTTANNKNANTTNAITQPKPEGKTRTKKAKQTAETKSATTSVTNPQQPLPISPSIRTNEVTPSSASDKKVADNQRQNPNTPAKKRKPRVPAPTETIAQPSNPPKRTRKKKADQATASNDNNNHNNNNTPQLTSNMTLPPLSVNPQLLSVASNIPMGASPLVSSASQSSYPSMQPLIINRNMPGMSPLDAQDPSQRFVSVSLSPYANHDYTNSLARQHSLSKLLFTSSSSSAVQTNPHSDEIGKAFEELRDHTWSHLSKCILEPAQQFDIPSLIGTLHELRADNEKQLKRVKELTLQREQLAAMNAKLDLNGPMLLQNLNQTSPGFASVVAGLQNSPKSLPNSSPSPAMNKSPIVPGNAYNHLPPGGSLGPPSILYDRNSPMVGMQTQHSGVNSLKSSMISTPSPPTSAFMAHGANNRAGLMTVNNSPYMSNVHPSMTALNSLGGPAPPSYYSRQ